MRLGISGTYSSGKTLTAMALSYYTGIPPIRARTMREILPEALPGKLLEECTAAELVQLIMIRHVERAVHEHSLTDSFISDGSSLQEWAYGTIRVTFGINPNESAHLSASEQVERTDEIRFFEAVMEQMGNAIKRHVKRGFDAFVHMPNELPIAEDGHRPVNDHFRAMADEMLLRVLSELELPYHLVAGSISLRLEKIVDIFGFTSIRPVHEAIALATGQYNQLSREIEAASRGARKAMA